MAKWKNLPVGTRVKVKNNYDSNVAADSASLGKTGIIAYREAEDYAGSCRILVSFDNDDGQDWMHTSDVKLVKDEA